MITYTATEAQNKFGQMFMQALAEPVHITKNSNDGVVVLPKKEFDLLEKLKLIQKDAYWVKLADEAFADKDGWLGVEESEKFLQGILNAPD